MARGLKEHLGMKIREGKGMEMRVKEIASGDNLESIAMYPERKRE
jgi:hypothetical protein